MEEMREEIEALKARACCAPVVLQARPGALLPCTARKAVFAATPLQADGHTHTQCHAATNAVSTCVALQANHREVLRQHGIAPQPSLTPGGVGGLRARR